MTDTANNNNENQNFHENSPQFSDSADYSDSVGKILQDARIKQKIDIKTISQAIKISSKQVEYIENQQWDKLPEKMVIFGFVKNYARYLKLDENSLLQKLASYQNLDKPVILEIDQGVNFEKTPSLKNFSGHNEGSHIKKIIIAIIVLLLIVGAVFLLNFTNINNVAELYSLDNPSTPSSELVPNVENSTPETTAPNLANQPITTQPNMMLETLSGGENNSNANTATTNANSANTTNAIQPETPPQPVNPYQ